jgi:hypothetical protein
MRIAVAVEGNFFLASFRDGRHESTFQNFDSVYLARSRRNAFCSARYFVSTLFQPAR